MYRFHLLSSTFYRIPLRTSSSVILVFMETFGRNVRFRRRGRAKTIKNVHLTFFDRKPGRKFGAFAIVIKIPGCYTGFTRLPWQKGQHIIL